MTMLLLTILILALPVQALAADSVLPGSVLLQTLWALLVVCGLILILYGLAKKRFLPRRIQAGRIEVLEVRHIMPKTSLARIRVGEQELLIGISATTISLLSELEPTERNGAGQNFDQILKETQ